MYQVSTYGTLCLLRYSLLHYSMLGIMYELFNETFKLTKTERKHLFIIWNLSIVSSGISLSLYLVIL